MSQKLQNQGDEGRRGQTNEGKEKNRRKDLLS